MMQLICFGGLLGTRALIRRLLLLVTRAHAPTASSHGRMSGREIYALVQRGRQLVESVHCLLSLPSKHTHARKRPHKAQSASVV